MRDLTKDNSVFEGFEDFEAYRHMGFLSPSTESAYRKQINAADRKISSGVAARKPVELKGVGPNRSRVRIQRRHFTKETEMEAEYDASRFYSVEIETDGNTLPLILKYGGDVAGNLRFKRLYDGAPKNSLANNPYTPIIIGTEEDFNLDPGPEFEERNFLGFAQMYVSAFLEECERTIRKIKKQVRGYKKYSIFQRSLGQNDGFASDLEFEQDNLDMVEDMVRHFQPRVRQMVEPKNPVQISFRDLKLSNMIYLDTDEVIKSPFSPIKYAKGTLVFIDQTCWDKRMFFTPPLMDNVFTSFYLHYYENHSRISVENGRSLTAEEIRKLEKYNAASCTVDLSYADVCGPVDVQQKLGFLEFYLKMRRIIGEKIESAGRKCGDKEKAIKDFGGAIEVINACSLARIEDYYKEIFGHY